MLAWGKGGDGGEPQAEPAATPSPSQTASLRQHRPAAAGPTAGAQGVLGNPYTLTLSPEGWLGRQRSFCSLPGLCTKVTPAPAAETPGQGPRGASAVTHLGTLGTAPPPNPLGQRQARAGRCAKAVGLWPGCRGRRAAGTSAGAEWPEGGQRALAPWPAPVLCLPGLGCAPPDASGPELFTAPSLPAKPFLKGPASPEDSRVGPGEARETQKWPGDRGTQLAAGGVSEQWTATSTCRLTWVTPRTGGHITLMRSRRGGLCRLYAVFTPRRSRT